MKYDIIIGRGESEKKKLGNKGLIFLGKSYVQMGQTTSLSNNVYLDVATSHTILVCGKKGSGKSYSLSVIAEEMANLPKEVNKNLSIILVDTMGIFWSMKYPNQRQEDLLKIWGLRPKGLNILIYTPKGKFKEYKEKKIPTDFNFSIKPSELSASDWCNVFDIKITDEIGVLIERTIDQVKKEKKDFSLDDILKYLKKDKKSELKIKNATENRFIAAKSWGLFDVEGTKIKDIVKNGQVSVLDLSCYSDWNLKALVVSLLSKKLLQERIDLRKIEEIKMIEKGQHYFSIDEEKEGMPLVWLAVDECLPYNSEIITDKAHTKIGDIVKRSKKGEKFKVLGYNLKNNSYNYYNVKKVYKKEVRDLIEIKTETGKIIKCTPNHKILTKKGFNYSALAKEIGVPAFQHYNQKEGSIKARLLGHIFGDGWITEKTKTIGFSGKGNTNDLLKIKEDLKSLGFSSSNVSSRMTNSQIKNYTNKIIKVKGLSQSIYSSHKAYYYFKNLCDIKGQKVLSKSKIPNWLFDAPEEEKCEFLAAFFGSDGNIISSNKNVKSDFNPIRLSFNKIEELEENAFEFAKEIKKLLNLTGINVSRILKRKGNIRKDGKYTIKIDLTIAKNVENMIKFLEKIGYRYCERKEIEANKWLSYLKYRNYLKKDREILRKKSLKLHKKGLGKTKISRILNTKEYWVREWIYKNRKARLPKNLPNYNEWINQRYENKIIYENIIDKKEIEKDYVYDISVDKVHNFIADGVIVHNCHEFLPKNRKTPATDALISLLREGRQPGISLILATQQPGEIHHDVITQSDIILSHRVTAQLDIEALNSIMQSYLSKDILFYLNNLPNLKGSAIILDDNSERIYPIRVRPKMSWHGGETPSSVKIKKQLFEI